MIGDHGVERLHHRPPELLLDPDAFGRPLLDLADDAYVHGKRLSRVRSSPLANTPSRSPVSLKRSGPGMVSGASPPYMTTP
jgi:hypothetical protein